MGSRKSDQARMREAIQEASNLHDGAHADPMALAMIARRDRIDLATLTRGAHAQAATNLARERASSLESEWSGYQLGNYQVVPSDDDHGWMELSENSWMRLVTLANGEGTEIQAVFSVTFDNWRTYAASASMTDTDDNVIGRRWGTDEEVVHLVPGMG